MSNHDRATMYAPSNTSHNAAVLPSGPSSSTQTGSLIPENDIQHRVRSGTSATLARSPPHRPQPSQFLVSFPLLRRHRLQRQTATEAGDSDSEADEEGLENTQRVELSYEGTLWAVETMRENGLINAKDVRTARERERPRPVEPRPAPLRVEFPFGPGGLISGRATLPSTRASATPQISPRTNEVPLENHRQAPPVRQASPHLSDFAAAANLSTRRPSHSQLSARPNEGSPARIPSYAQAAPPSNELPPGIRRRAPSVRSSHPSWWYE